MRTVTIGGNRLGAGKKMRQAMKGYERSTHNLNKNLKTTLSAGTLVPFWNQIGVPDDTFDLELNCDIITSPTIGPQFDSFKVQLDVFEIPFRLYIALLHNNALNIGRDMSQVKIPQLFLMSNLDTYENGAQVNPSCILSYLGINGIGRQGAGTGSYLYRAFNALGLLSYWDIYKTYYANKQEEFGVAIHSPLGDAIYVTSITTTTTTGSTGNTPQYPLTNPLYVGLTGKIVVNYATAGAPAYNNVILYTNYGILLAEDAFNTVSTTGVDVTYSNPKYNLVINSYGLINSNTDTVKAPELVTFPLENIDDMRNDLLTTIGQYTITQASPAPYNYALQFDANRNTTAKQTQEGLGIKCYQSDKFNNWIETEWIDGPNGINEVSAVSTAGDKFTIDSLNIANKVYNMLNRIALSDGSYKSWIETVYDTDFYMQCTSPMYVGGLSKELIFQKIISNSASNAGGTEQPLGTYASIGGLSSKHKGGHIRIKCHEPSMLMGIISITPRIIYSQGNQWYTNLKTIDDLHKPELDEIGFQDLITDQMNAWDTVVPVDGNPLVDLPTFKSAGKQVAYMDYMTDYNEAKGNFAIESNLMFMTLNRRYETNAGGIADLTTYIDPVKYNYIFADPSLDAMNFWAEIDIKCTARRKMSAKQIPYL